jgi:hypothetical protein
VSETPLGCGTRIWYEFVLGAHVFILTSNRQKNKASLNFTFMSALPFSLNGLTSYERWISKKS